MNTALSYRRQTVEFASGDGVCGGYLHLPLHVTRPPVVLMAGRTRSPTSSGWGRW